jgi:hypothetical protein
MFWINPAVAVVSAVLWLSFCRSLSVYLSRSSVGQLLGDCVYFKSRRGCLPPVVADTVDLPTPPAQESPAAPSPRGADPRETASMCGFTGRTAKSPRTQECNNTLREFVLRKGLDALSSSQKASLLRDAESLRMLHNDVYRRGAVQFANHRTCEDLHRSPRITEVDRNNHQGQEPV